MCEMMGLGLDLCQISRMKKLLSDGRFLLRWFTPEEQEYIRSKGGGAAQTMAGIYAAKEAFAKAVGTGITFDLRQVEVIHSPAGTPSFRLTGEALRLCGEARPLLSVTHENDMAAAVCILTR